MHFKHLDTLQALGLSENEARVYLAALQLGASSVQQIANVAEVKRTTAYTVLAALRKRELVHEEYRGFKRVITAEPPTKLEVLVEERRIALSDSMPELAAMYHLKPGDDSIKFYEGIDGTKRVYEELLEDIGPRQDYLVMSAMSSWLKLDQKFYEKFTLRRAELSRRLGFKIRLLLQDTADTRRHKKMQRTYNEKIKILPQSVSLTTNLVIIPKKVVIHQLVPPIHAMVIHNPNVIRMHREMFELLWSTLPDIQ